MKRGKFIQLAVIGLGLCLGTILQPWVVSLAQHLKAPEQREKLAEAMALMKIKANVYRKQVGDSPKSFQQLLKHDPASPPYYKLEKLSMIDFMRGGDGMVVRPEWEVFEGILDPIGFKAEDAGLNPQIKIRLHFGSEERCYFLARQFLIKGVIHRDKLNTEWYDSFRVSVDDWYDDSAYGKSKKELKLELGRGPDGGPTLKNLEEARLVCKRDASFPKDSTWQIEWVGL